MESFVKRNMDLEWEALNYIENKIREKGEIKVEPDEDGDELSVPCYDHFTGEPFNLVVQVIKEDSICGVTQQERTKEVVRQSDYADGAAMWLADYVARYYKEL